MGYKCELQFNSILIKVPIQSSLIARHFTCSTKLVKLLFKNQFSLSCDPCQTLNLDDLTLSGFQSGVNRPDLEESRVRRLLVVLLGCMLPRDAEHGFLLVFPAQSWIFPALYLGYQPLFHVHLRSRFHFPHRRCKTRRLRSETHVQSHFYRLKPAFNGHTRIWG